MNAPQNTQYKERLTMKTCKSLLPALAIGLIAGSASAAILPGDTRNFEGGTDGSPFNTALYNINSPTAVVEDDGTAQSPLNNSGATTGVGTTNTKGILLTNASATDAPRTGAEMDDFLTNTTYYIQFDYKVIEGGSNAGIQIRETNNGSGAPGLNVHFGSNGFVQVNQGSGFNGTDEFGMAVVLGDWYRMTLTVDPLNQTEDSFDMRLQSLDADGVYLDQTVTGLGFQNDQADMESFIFHFNAGASLATGQFAVDNVRFTSDADDLVFDTLTPVPEPGSLALLGLGGLLMIQRRRRG